MKMMLVVTRTMKSVFEMLKSIAIPVLKKREQYRNALIPRTGDVREIRMDEGNVYGVRP